MRKVQTRKEQVEWQDLNFDERELFRKANNLDDAIKGVNAFLRTNRVTTLSWMDLPLFLNSNLSTQKQNSNCFELTNLGKDLMYEITIAEYDVSFNSISNCIRVHWGRNKHKESEKSLMEKY